MTPVKITRKKYACQRCGHEKTQETNHHGQTVSWGRYNVCPKCPPWAKYPEHGIVPGTVWICQEENA